VEKMNCPSCGKEIIPDAKFCPECGIPMGNYQGSHAEKAHLTKTGFRDTGIIVGVLVLMASAYFILRLPSHSAVSAEPKQPYDAMQNQPPSHPEIPGMANQPEMAMIDSLPKDYESMVMYGNQFMDNGQFPLAAECYKRALATNSSSTDVRVDYGACLHAMGLGDRALREFRTVLESKPAHPIAIFNVGVVFMDKKLKDSAKTYFDKYLSLEPDGRASEAAKQFLNEIGK
jgi:tetratricopeptide (TPR) repeat protein